MSEENANVVREMFAAWNRHDYETAQAAFDPEIETEQLLGSVTDGTFHGYEGLRKMLRPWGAFAEFRSDPTEVVVAGDQVFATVDHSGRGKASGVDVAMKNWQVFTLQKGKIVRYRLFNDRDRALEAAGLRE